MEERKLNWERNDDPTLVDVDNKLINEIKTIYNHITLNLSFCFEQLKNNKLTEGMKKTHLSLSESYLIEFLEKMNYDSQLKKEKDERYLEIRELNKENDELRKQLGEKVTNEDLREKIKNLSKEFRKWWNIYGFGHTSEIEFNEYGYFYVKLSGMITKPYYFDDKKLKFESKLQYLNNLGFEIIKNDRRVIVSNKSNEILDNLIKSKFPSAKIDKININNYDGKYGYDSIYLYIFKLDDFN